MEQFVFVLIIGAISLVKWLMEKSAEQRAARETERRVEEGPRKSPPAPPILAPRPVASPIPDFERTARRLREALGLPEEAEIPRPVIARHPVVPTPPPVEMPPARPAIHHPVEFVIAPERRVLAPSLALRPAPVSVPGAETPRAAIEDLLHSREGLRRAILAQEILGTPKGLVF